MREISRELPPGFDAAVFVVSHLTPRGGSRLPQVLNMVSAMPAVHAAEGMQLQRGRIYVAPPDRHLLIAGDHMHVTRGPKEGLHRPAINATFRSAAQSHGADVIGVLLSGMLDDGAAGLWEIMRNGGIGVVQDPDEAAYSSMPLNAVHDSPVNFCVKTRQIAPLLVRLVAGEEVTPAHMNGPIPHAAEFSGFTCPECHGPLRRKELNATLMEFRCDVGHVFSPKALLDEHTSMEERKLYEAILALNEGARLAELTGNRLSGSAKDQMLQEADQLRQYSADIRRMIDERMTPPADGEGAAAD